jgi:anti-sigma factor ChrR (cupin superfamily)
MLRSSLAIAALLLLSATAAERKSFIVQSSQIPWQAMHIPGFPEGLQQRLLHDNKDNHLMSALVKYPKGFHEPRHYHTTCGHTIYVLKGRIRTPKGDLTPGSFAYDAVNERHGPLIAVEESEILFYTDGPFDMHIEDAKP